MKRIVGWVLFTALIPVIALELLFVALVGWVAYSVALAYSLPRKAVDCSYASFHPDYNNEVRAQCRKQN